LWREEKMMKMKLWNVLMLAGALSLAAGPRAHGVRAAVGEAVEEARAPAEARVIVAIKLRHVAPGLMARWLYAARPPVLPPLLEQPAAGLADVTVLPNEEAGEIWVRAAPSAMASLRRVVAFLDQPQPQVEVEVQAVSVARADVPRLIPVEPLAGANSIAPPDAPPGAAPNPAPNPAVGAASDSTPWFSLSLVRGAGYKVVLKEMLQSGRASSLLEQRFTLVNGTSVALQARPLRAQPSRFQAQITPTINGGNTITSALQISSGGAGAGTQSMNTIFSVRDGETVALILSNTGDATGQATLAFLTPRIVHRADEAK